MTRRGVTRVVMGYEVLTEYGLWRRGKLQDSTPSRVFLESGELPGRYITNPRALITILVSVWHETNHESLHSRLSHMYCGGGFAAAGSRSRTWPIRILNLIWNLYRLSAAWRQSRRAMGKGGIVFYFWEADATEKGSLGPNTVVNSNQKKIKLKPIDRSSTHIRRRTRRAHERGLKAEGQKNAPKIEAGSGRLSSDET